MLSIQALRDLGANVDEGLERCLNMEDFYLGLVSAAIEDPSFERLGKALAEGDLDGAFAAAHSLKGAYGNLSLTPLFEPANRITEILRAKTGEDCSALYAELSAARDRLIEAAK